jgi:hypothetical protein
VYSTSSLVLVVERFCWLEKSEFPPARCVNATREG